MRKKFAKNSKKRNPKENLLTEKEYGQLESDLTYGVALGLPVYLSDSLLLLQQGSLCADCYEVYTSCSCERCRDCGFNRCLCEYNLIVGNYDSDVVRKLSWSLIKKHFDEDYLKDIKNKIYEVVNAHYNRIKNHNYLRELKII